MSRTTEARPHSDQHEPTTIEIEIEVKGRWDALALSELLIPFHSFLVQHGHERWVIHARAPGCRGESLSEALASIDVSVPGAPTATLATGASPVA